MRRFGGRSVFITGAASGIGRATVERIASEGGNVRLFQAQADELPGNEVDMPAAMAAGRTDFLAMGMDRAYCGAPAEATAAEGRQTFDTLTDMLVELIEEHA